MAPHPLRRDALSALQDAFTAPPAEPDPIKGAPRWQQPALGHLTMQELEIAISERQAALEVQAPGSIAEGLVRNALDRLEGERERRMTAALR